MKAFIITIIFFCILSFFIFTNTPFIESIDKETLDFFAQNRVYFLDFYFSAITWIGSLFILIPLSIILFFLLYKSKFKYLKQLVLMSIGAISSTYILKYIFDRARPSFHNELAIPFGPSYPSAHSTQITIFALILIILVKYYNIKNSSYYNLSIFIMFFSVIISRMYLQVHFLSDVVGGILIGLIFYFYYEIKTNQYKL